MDRFMISFIIPAYNEEKYIVNCVRSLLAQKNVPSFEVIVVDNNSKDATAEIVQAFPVRLVHEVEQGLTKARNRGAKEAKGDLFVFVDADTMLPEDWSEKMLSYFSKDPQLVGVSGPSRFYDLPVRYKIVGEFMNFQIVFPLIGEFLLKTVLRRGALWNGAVMAVKKESFERVGGFDRGIIFYGEDADLARKLLKVGHIKFVQDLWVLTSARRFLKGNVWKEGIMYVLPYVWFMFTQKSLGKSYKAIR